ncbi:MAG TPA: hypothetical protein PLJ34_11275 [Hyphomicrobiales bacterium]|nr:hypothetical protein [Hyphomicrobiales bacterium]
MTANVEKPDFDALRAARNESVAKVVARLCDEHGWDPNFAGTTFDPNACYCACAEGGPCEHDFSGWRDFDDGRGGEKVCSRCGMGAMSHTLHTCWDI